MISARHVDASRREDETRRWLDSSAEREIMRGDRAEPCDAVKPAKRKAFSDFGASLVAARNPIRGFRTAGRSFARSADERNDGFRVRAR